MELRILEYFAALCLFLSIIRPLVRGLWNLDGLAVCPLLALAVFTGIFPAYGFRPECIPLLVFALSLTVANFSDLSALFFGLQSDSYRDRSLLFTLVSAVLFAAVLWVGIYYAPPMDTELSSKGASVLFLRDENGGLLIRVYRAEDAAGPAEDTVLAADSAERPVENLQGLPAQSVQIPGRPLLVMLPPAAGSLAVIDDVCMALRDRGFTVLTYSRPGFDSPSFDREGMPVRLFIPGLYRLGNALARGQTDAAANASGRKLETIRRQDTEILLRELKQNRMLQNMLEGTDQSNLFLAGYGAGGAALTVLAGDDAFAARNPRIRGIVAIEAPLLSSLEGEALPERFPPENPVSGFFFRMEAFAQSFVPRKIIRIGKVPRPVLPILFILSDRVINERSGRYETILRAMGASRSMAILAAVPGAGPFDYSGSPRQYPLLSALFRGAARTPAHAGEAAGPELTAALITNFAALLLDAETENASPPGGTTPDEIPQPGPLTVTPLHKGIYLETGGVWRIPGGRSILQP